MAKNLPLQQNPLQVNQSIDQNKNNPTIIALSTPPGVGAIAMIRITGPAALDMCSLYWSGQNLKEVDGHTLHFGKIISSDQNAKIIDEVVLGIYKSPNSFTGEDLVEINCHASPYIIQEILSLYATAGCTPAQPGEFTMRAFLNGKMDLSQSEAVADLIASESEAMHRVAMNQLKGGVSNEIKELRTQLIDFASLIELELDFSEEDVEFANRNELIELVQKINARINSLIKSFELGNAIKHGINTVIAGRPNAGKSTLLNVLLQDERAIVSDIPGTTRDTIEETLNINGVQFRMIDTAGIREAQDKIEAIGVSKTMEKVAQSAILLYLFDVTELTPEQVWSDIKKLKTANNQIIAVANKMDLNPYIEPQIYVSEFLPAENIITLSAKNNMNVEYLKEKLYNAIVGLDQKVPDVIINNVRHVHALKQAKERLDAVLEGFESGLTTDFIAMDIRQSLHYLGEITGQISSDDLLGNIFGKFCIGK